MNPPETSIEFTTGAIGSLLVFVALLSGCRGAGQSGPGRPIESVVELHRGWAIAPATQAGGSGAEIADVAFDDSNWTPASVPTTVLAAQVEAGEIRDPYYGRNLETIDPQPYAGPWWYRTEFPHPNRTNGRVRLVLEGLNYSAEVWLNGAQVAARPELTGSFRIFDLDITPFLRQGDNALAIQVFPPQPGDPTIGFVDWNPTPPDRNMGLWRPVKLRVTGDVALDEIFVDSDVDLDGLEHAALTVSARVTNFADQARQATIVARIDGDIEIERTIDLAPGEMRQLVLGPGEHPELELDQPRLWWPNNMGEPNLYAMEMSATVEGEMTDSQRLTFGIRHIDEYLTEEGYRGYTVNGKQTLIRGGGWVDDLMLADDRRKIEDQLRYVRHMNLNTIRLEGFWGSGHDLFDLADRYGILIMVGWSCQWEWENYLGGPVDEFGGIDTPEEIELVATSLHDQVVWLRNHPSVFLWVLASDMLPRPTLESRYREVLAEVDTSRPALAACAVRDSEVSGPTGVKMNGPYDYVPPTYWYLDTDRGGAYGFNTETGPGPQPPPLQSIQRMMPEADWWPVNDMWNYHSGRNEFSDIDNYYEALSRRYGEPQSLEDFTRKAQLANYEAMRPMFEAFSVRRPQTTGIIQWMLNSAWPELYWQLYDHYLVPNGAFYGTRVANRPLHVVFDYGNRELIAVNDTVRDLAQATLNVRVLDFDSELLQEDSTVFDLPAGSRRSVSTLGEVETRKGVYFVDLRLLSAQGEEVASNFYWLPVEMDELDWAASEWFYTPIARFADMTALQELPEAEIEVEHRFEARQGGSTAVVELENPGQRIAFFIELGIVGAASGRLAAPVEWDDNYITLLPGESRVIHGFVPEHALPEEAPEFRYRGWNVSGS